MRLDAPKSPSQNNEADGDRLAPVIQRMLARRAEMNGELSNAFGPLNVTLPAILARWFPSAPASHRSQRNPPSS